MQISGTLYQVCHQKNHENVVSGVSPEKSVDLLTEHLRGHNCRNSGQKVIIRFREESPLSSASTNRLTAFCRPFVHYASLCAFSILV